MTRTTALVAGAALWGLAGSLPAAAETVMQQCGQQYQAAKAAGTLNGMTWNQYRTDCATRLKATPAAATTPAAAPAAEPAANPLKPSAATTAASPAPAPAAVAATPATPTAAGTAKPMSAGRTAFVARERQCGAEWKANKPTLVAQTPGLTWPKYLSQCNAKLKAAGQ